MSTMTKTQARTMIRRARAALTDFQNGLYDNDLEWLRDAALEASGAVAALLEYVDEHDTDLTA